MLAAAAAVNLDGTLDILTDGCTYVTFGFSFDAANVSGVSPRLKLLFELPDERLCKKWNEMKYFQILDNQN